MATRDFNLIPAMLRQRFKLPVDKMEFPPVERRVELSGEEQSHSDILTAVLCREGVAPYSEAVVGAARLRRAVRTSAVLACLGALAGLLLAFYLTFVCSYSSLSAVNLLVFLVMWLVPTPADRRHGEQVLSKNDAPSDGRGVSVSKKRQSRFFEKDCMVEGGRFLAKKSPLPP